MSKKQKYRAKPQHFDDGYDVADERGWSICIAFTLANARKIARALNAMEAKPKAKPFKFDWSGIPEQYKWAAMDEDCSWWIYAMKPCTDGDAEGWYADDDDEVAPARAKNAPPYPGDWRDSLQKRPGK